MSVPMMMSMLIMNYDFLALQLKKLPEERSTSVAMN
jgi:hypothetical protein